METKQSIATVSERIADFVQSFSMDSLPKEVVERAKTLVLDSLGNAVLCMGSEATEAIRKTILGSSREGWNGKLWGTDTTCALEDSVIYNAALIHGNDYDDTHVAAIVHPGAAVNSASITLGAALGKSGRQILEAMMIGWVVAVELGVAAKGGFHDKGFHATAILASFSAAASIAKLLGCSREETINAIGICGSQSAGIQAFLADGTWSKRMHPGWGAHSALYAIRLAQNGFKGPLQVFEAKFGMWLSHLGTKDGLDEVLTGDRAAQRIMEITPKLYPVCHMTHAYIACMQELQHKHQITADKIASIHCKVDPLFYEVVCEPKQEKWHPTSDYTLRFSLPYIVAVCAVTGTFRNGDLDLSHLEKAEIRSLMSRITCESDVGVRSPGHFPGWMEVRLHSGEKYVVHHPQEPGAPSMPIDHEQVMGKFRDNTAQHMTEQQMTQINQLVMDLDTLPRIDSILELMVPSK